jgi:hypothetical protein
MTRECDVAQARLRGRLQETTCPQAGADSGSFPDSYRRRRTTHQTTTATTSMRTNPITPLTSKFGPSSGGGTPARTPWWRAFIPRIVRGPGARPPLTEAVAWASAADAGDLLQLGGGATAAADRPAPLSLELREVAIPDLLTWGRGISEQGGYRPQDTPSAVLTVFGLRHQTPSRRNRRGALE